MKLDDELKRLHLEADYLEAVETVVDEHGAIIMGTDDNTMRLVALNLARIIACHGIDGRVVPVLGQNPEHERQAVIYLANLCQLFGEVAHDRPPEN